MFDHRYQLASVLLFDPQTAMRHSTRTALLNIGFGEVEAVSDHDIFLKKARSGNFDLVIGDTRSNDGNTVELVRQIRHNELGRNPFVNVIITLWDASPDHVQSIIDSGADDLISRPMSTKQISERIGGLVRSRKPFIVTSNYIGPERRTIVRGLTTGSHMVVPNSLQAKVEDRPDLDATPENISAALGAVNSRKISIYTEQFLRSSSQILGLSSEAEHLDERRALIEDMKLMNKDLEKRIGGTEFSHVSALCGALDDLLSRIIRSSGMLSEQEKELVMQIPFAIHKGCQELRESAGLAFDIRDLSAQIKKAGTSSS
ncbi:MAG: response regulator [Sneathiella sp.]